MLAPWHRSTSTIPWSRHLSSQTQIPLSHFARLITPYRRRTLATATWSTTMLVAWRHHKAQLRLTSYQTWARIDLCDSKDTSTHHPSSSDMRIHNTPNWSPQRIKKTSLWWLSRSSSVHSPRISNRRYHQGSARCSRSLNSRRRSKAEGAIYCTPCQGTIFSGKFGITQVLKVWWIQIEPNL